jgi:hypothetical protein
VVFIGDVALDPGNSTTIPIMIYDATDAAAVGLSLTYDASVVSVTGAEQGDFTGFFGDDISNAANGWVTINTFIIGTQLTGNPIVANVTLQAIGSPGNSSPLNLEVISMAEKDGYEMPRTTRNGTFSIPGAAPVAPATVPAFTPLGTLVIIGLLCAISNRSQKKRKI